MVAIMFEHFMWLPFLLAITVLTLSPGVDTVLVLRNSARGGRKDGFLTSFGICLGLFAHAIISAAGLSAILLSSAELFNLLKYAGAAYLFWLGFQSLRSAFKGGGLQLAKATGVSFVPASKSLREGLLSNVLNPKTVVFYMAFLPQFIDINYSPIPQALMMASVHFLIAMVWQGLLVLMVSKARIWLQRPAVSTTMDGATGVLLMGFGLKLGTS